MIIGVGIDICDIKRFRRIVLSNSPLYFERLLSKGELIHFQSIRTLSEKAKWLAGVFSIKEATLKAMGTGIDGRYHLSHIHTYCSSGRKFYILLSESIIKQFGHEIDCHLDLAFSSNEVIATVVLSLPK